MSGFTLLLVGAGGHARACIDVIEAEGRFRVGGLVGLAHQVGEVILGYPVLGTDDDLALLKRAHRYALVAVGQIITPDPRIRLFNRLGECGYQVPSIVSPRAHVSRHAAVAAGTIVMHGALVNAGATIGENCILNSLSLVEHDSAVGNHCHIATAAAVNSGVQIADGTFVGSNACIRQGIRIGERCVIGMGQRVLRDCAAGSRLPPHGDRS
jgi:sugar O-acyltransferase (sialic acid O-acetyltransferase NeuD family)